MNKKTILLACILALAIAVPFACKTQKSSTAAVDKCAGVAATYSADIKPIIDANCLKCHGAGSPKGDFTTYEGLKTVAASGELEFKVIHQQSMPPKGPLPEEDRKKISCWLSSGFQNN